MSTLKVDAIRHNSASSDAITTAADGTASAKLTDVGGGPLSHRNLLMNGQFDIWQRATDSGSTTDSGYVSADRWKSNASGGTYQITRQSFSPGQTDVPDNPKYYLRFAVTTGNNNVSLGQRIEGVERVQGEYTLSFWAKGTNPPGGQYSIINRQDFGSGGSVSSVVDTGVGNFTVTSSWVKKTFTFTPPSISGKTLGTTHTGFYECQIFRQPAGDNGTSAYTIDIANVQFERGSVSTKYEQRTNAEELSNCQRYYNKVYDVEGQSGEKPFLLGTYLSGSEVACVVNFPKMRVIPSLDISNGTNVFMIRRNNASDNFNTLAMRYGTTTTAELYTTSNVSGTGGHCGIIRGADTDVYIAFQAEI